MNIGEIPVVLTEDQVRIIRGLITDKVEYLAGWEAFFSFVDDLRGILALLDAAEGTIPVKPASPRTWSSAPLDHGGNAGWRVGDGSWRSHT